MRSVRNELQIFAYFHAIEKSALIQRNIYPFDGRAIPIDRFTNRNWIN